MNSLHIGEAVIYAVGGAVALGVTVYLVKVRRIPFKKANALAEWSVIILIAALLVGVTLYNQWAHQ